MTMYLHFVFCTRKTDLIASDLDLLKLYLSHICCCNEKIYCSHINNTGDFKIITDSRIQSIICKGPKYRFTVPIDFKSCRKEIAVALQEFCNRW